MGLKLIGYQVMDNQGDHPDGIYSLATSANLRWRYWRSDINHLEWCFSDVPARWSVYFYCNGLSEAANKVIV
jgi:hypothetical protein